MLRLKHILFSILGLAFCLAQNTPAATGDISTVAGGGVKDNAPASESMVSGPWNMFIDVSDNIYIADWRGNRITKVDASGNFSVVVGNGIYSYDGDGSPAKEMSITGPTSVAADSDGNVYFQFQNGELRKADPSGNVSTVLSGSWGRFFVDGSDNIYYQSNRGIRKYNPQTGETHTLVRSENLGVPGGLTMDNQGNLYLANEWDFEVIKVSAAGRVSKVAGNGDRGEGEGTFSGDGGAAINAGFSLVVDVAVDASGNIYVADNGNRRIRKVDAATGIVTTYAGTGTEGNTGDGGPATSAQIGAVSSIALDSAGNLYIADETNSVVRKVDTSGVISTFAGGGDDQDGGTAASNLKLFGAAVAVDKTDNIYIASVSSQVVFKIDAQTSIAQIVAGKLFEAGFDGDGGAATSAKLNNPRRIHVDASGDLYILDTMNQRVRKVAAATGIITTVAGNGEEGFSGDGPATEVSLQIPWGGGLVTDGSGNLYISDRENNIVRKVDAATGQMHTLLGNETGWGYRRALDGRLAGGIEINSIQDLSVDAAGNVYIADQGDDKIWKVDAATGMISTVAGTGQGGFSGDGGPATQAQLNNPRGVYVDAAGNVYIGDRSNARIRKVDAATGIITTIAGGNAAGDRGTLRGTAAEGAPATDVWLGSPQGVSKNSRGEVHFTDRGSKRIYRIDASGNLHTVAGTYLGDGGPATEAHLASPEYVFVASDGSMYITDNTHLRVRKVDPSGTISTIVGDGGNIASGDGGPAALAGLQGSRGVFVDASGNVFVHGNSGIRKIDASGNISTIAGNPEAETRGDGGSATQASLWGQGIFVDGSGSVYFAQGDGIRKVDTHGVITTVAGNNGYGFSGDGGPAIDAQLNSVRDLFIDNDGNLYLADTNNRRIRKIDAATGIITTVAGNGERTSTGDGGPATEAALADPWGIFVDGAGSIFVAERYESKGNRIRKIDASGIITTVAGNGQRKFQGDGVSAMDASLWIPSDVFVDGNGDLFIADQANQRIRKVEGIGAPTTLNPGVYQGPTNPELITVEAGSNVEVSLPDPGDDTPAISLTFDNISDGGVTSVTPVTEGPPPPKGLRLGEQTVYYDLNTTASFSGPVEMCFNYTGMDVGNESELKLFHFVNEEWTDITTSIDTQNNIICGEASSFSFFAMFIPLPSPPTPKHLSVVKATVTQGGTPVVGATVSFARSVAGHADVYLWEGTTDEAGNARIEILIENALLRKGASGYYKARVTSTSGSVLDTWHSVPITGEQEVVLTFPIGETLIIGDTRKLDFGLAANVPNPFNPATTIAYQIPESGDVSLVVYNALGQQVRTLVSKFQPAGQYRVVWNGKDALGHSVSSGVYFYRLISNDNVQTRRMLLLK